ncbi:hypothetical protein BN946_scf184985.g127 [Trametes cinnabarina]|uniref:Uncharacterized protein n=1 Tax=Pycnoporus cinnabarinus TaxID=5643 RepID=A0A060SDY9_PYCCI|nr:hypothetical protein BN946_scf184985.g127 [Trametes cinnabarina]
MQLISSSSLLALAFAFIATRSPLACMAASPSPQNVTVDDTLGSPDGSVHVVYSPSDAWNTGQNCTSCAVKTVDKNETLNGTWHEATYDVQHQQQITATLVFNGTAVYAYGIVPHTDSNATSSIYLSFILDNAEVGAFVRTPAGNGTTEYNVPLYSKDGLSAGTHNLTVLVGNAAFDGSQSVALLDYFVYTHDNSSGSSSAVALAPDLPSIVSVYALLWAVPLVGLLLGA